MSRPADMDPRLLEVLACPVSRTSLRFEPVKGELISDAARLAFAVREGVPILVLDEARELSPEE
jgi:uncharacterized protein